MAISKIKSTSIEDDAITSAKVADGVISAADVADGTLTNAKLADGTIENAKLAGSIANDKLANSSVTINGNSVSLGASASIAAGMFRNIFINGDMSIAQRGTTSSSTGYQTVDRWQLVTGTQQEQKTDTPNARFSNSFEVTGTTAGSSGYGICSQRIESKNVLPVLGQTCTLSAYVKNTGTSTVNVSVEVYRANSTDNFSGLTLLTSLTGQAITTSWNRITFPSFTVTDACATGLEVRIFRYDASNDQEWLLTGVQLEAGTTASDFEFLPYDVNLQRCQRYYWQQISSDSSTVRPVAVGSYIQNTYIEWTTQFPVQMRATPSLVSPTVTNGYEIYRAGAADSFNEVLLGNSTQYMAFLYNNTQVSGTGGQAGSIYCPNTYASSIAFSAEL